MTAIARVRPLAPVSLAVPTPSACDGSGRPAVAAHRPVPELSVVVPARDERNNIAPLVAEIRAALDGAMTYEIVYVDDGSTDGTLAELARVRDAGAPMLRILRHERSRGQSLAVLAGVRAARAPLIATLDADGQNVPADIPGLFALARSQPPGAHWCIAGHRTMRRDTRWKRFQSRVANRVRAAILQDATPDTGCGLKLMPRDTWLLLPGFDHMHRFLPALVRRIGGEVLVRPVSHRPRTADASKYGMWDRLLPGLVDLLGMLWLGRRLKRTDAVELDAP